MCHCVWSSLKSLIITALISGTRKTTMTTKTIKASSYYRLLGWDHFLTAVSTKENSTLTYCCTASVLYFMFLVFHLLFHQFVLSTSVSTFPKTPWKQNPQKSRLKLLHQVSDCGANSDTFSVVGTKALSHGPMLPKQTSRHGFGNFKTARLNKRLTVSALNTSTH